jgi:uncharacterized membrane protein
MRAPLALIDRIGFVTWMALIALQCAWYAWLFPPAHLPMGVALAVAVIPLLLPLLALRSMRRALLWVGILSLFYFCHGIAESWSSTQERWPALLEVFLTLLLIGTLGAGVKRKPAARAG